MKPQATPVPDSSGQVDAGTTADLSADLSLKGQSDRAGTRGLPGRITIDTSGLSDYDLARLARLALRDIARSDVSRALVDLLAALAVEAQRVRSERRHPADKER